MVAPVSLVSRIIGKFSTETSQRRQKENGDPNTPGHRSRQLPKVGFRQPGCTGIGTAQRLSAPSILLARMEIQMT